MTTDAKLAKIPKAVLIAMLREVYAENAQLRQLNKEWAIDSKAKAQQILKLKDRAAANFGVDNFAARCREYCEQNNVRSVPADVVREWRHASH